MYKQVKIFGHPLHPMLVAFPIAFYTGAFVSFIVYALTFDIFWFRVAYVANVAGVAMAVVAAFPGLIDLILLPEDSKARMTGFKHMGFNMGALLLFFANFLMQMNKWNAPGLPDSSSAIVLSGLGVFCTICAGFLGWSLVRKHHVGVDLSPEQQKLEPVDDQLKKVA